MLRKPTKDQPESILELVSLGVCILDLVIGIQLCLFLLFHLSMVRYNQVFLFIANCHTY
jgi:hypothetical protein